MIRSSRRGPAPVAALIVTLCVLGALSACSNEESAGASSTGDVSQTGLEAAQQALAPWLEAPDPDLDVQPLPELDEGAEVIFLKCGVPACVPFAEGAEAAAEAAGVDFTVLDAGNTPESQTRAWDQAVAEKPAAVLEVGFQLPLFEKQLGELKAAGIPVVTAGDLGADVDYNVTPAEDFETIGGTEANYVISESEGKANVLFVTTKEVPLLGPIQDGFDTAIAENCPACTLDHLDIQLANIGRSVPGQIVSYLQRHPETRWINVGFGDIAAGVPEAIRGAGITGVKITGGAGSKLNWAYIQTGDQEMSLAAGNDLVGWMMLDGAVRMAAGQDAPESPPLRQQVITKATADFDPNEGWVPVPDYPDQFKEGWASQG